MRWVCRVGGHDRGPPAGPHPADARRESRTEDKKPLRAPRTLAGPTYTGKTMLKSNLSTSKRSLCSLRGFSSPLKGFGRGRVGDHFVSGGRGGHSSARILMSLRDEEVGSDRASIKSDRIVCFYDPFIEFCNFPKQQ